MQPPWIPGFRTTSLRWQAATSKGAAKSATRIHSKALLRRAGTRMASKKRTVKAQTPCAALPQNVIAAAGLQELEVHETQIEEDAIQSMRHMLQASEAEPLQALEGSFKKESVTMNIVHEDLTRARAPAGDEVHSVFQLGLDDDEIINRAFQACQ